MGSAIPVAREGYHRRFESSTITSSALRPDYLHIFQKRLGDFDTCRSDRFDVSYEFNEFEQICVSELAQCDKRDAIVCNAHE